MQKTLNWHLYVAFYTFCFGVSLLFFPNQIIPHLGFNPTEEPWIRIVGMFGLVLCYLAMAIYRKKIIAMLFHSIVMRGSIVLFFILLPLVGYPPFFYVFALIVGIGVVGSAIAYRSEIQHYRASA